MTTEPHSYESAFLAELAQDVRVSASALAAQDTQAHRRSYVRTVFASIEGTANHLKIIALERGVASPTLFSNAEIAILREEAYALNAKGEAYVQPRFLRTEDNLVFALRMYMRDLPAAFEIDRGGRGWQSFIQALSIRHRVTHPRRVADLEISDDEMKHVHGAYAWFNYTVVNNLLNAVTELRRRTGETH